MWCYDQPGDTIPRRWRVIDSVASVDSAITGESAPVIRNENQVVTSLR
jgi:high-affinity K+ transport system ATPase subunit B